MSEYQYYEFQAIERPLADRQMRELRQISTRATITRTRFSNYYTYGDLKANPRDLLARYFDASLYFANWHMVEVAFRFPGAAIDGSQHSMSTKRWRCSPASLVARRAWARS